MIESIIVILVYILGVLVGGYSYKYCSRKVEEEKPLPKSANPIESMFKVECYENGYGERVWVVKRKYLIWTTLTRDNYAEYEIPDFMGFAYKPLDNEEDFAVGFVHKESAEDIMGQIVFYVKGHTWEKVEEHESNIG